MSYQSNAIAPGARSFYVLESDLDECVHECGQGNCLSNPPVGGKCHKTKSTCIAPDSYLARERVNVVSATILLQDELYLPGYLFDGGDGWIGATVVVLSGQGKGEVRTVTAVSFSAPDTTVIKVDAVYSAAPDQRPQIDDRVLIHKYRTRRFCKNVPYLPHGIDAIPCLVGEVGGLSAKIQPFKGLSRRAQITLTAEDFKHHDRGEDPYYSERLYDPSQGTYFGKLGARQTFHGGRPGRLYVGHLVPGVPFDLADYQRQDYLLGKIGLPDERGRVEIRLDDILDVISDKKAVCPLPSDGRLLADLPVGVTAFSVESGQGVGYPLAGVLCVGGSEVMLFARVGDDFFVSRGERNTAEKSHKAGAEVQLCYDVVDKNIVDMFEEFLLEYSGCLPQWWDGVSADFYRLGWCSGYIATTTIVKPTAISKLIEQISSEYQVYIYSDYRNQKIKVSANMPPKFDVAAEIDEERHIIGGSYRQKLDDKKRITRVVFRYGKLDPTKDGDDNYPMVAMVPAVNIERSDGLDGIEIKEFKSQWVKSPSLASVIAYRLVQRYAKNPYEIGFALSPRDAETLFIGDNAKLTHSKLQRADGAAMTVYVQVLSVKETKAGERYDFESLATQFTGNYGLIAPNSLAGVSYVSATDDQRLRYVFFAGDSGYMSNGDRGYSLA